MHKIVFKRWARRRLASLNGGSFNLRMLAAHAQTHRDTHLQALLLLYSLSDGCYAKLSQFIWNEQLATEFEQAALTIGSRDVEKLALRGTPLLALPSNYNAVLAEFAAAYDAQAFKENEKRSIWQQTRLEQLQKGISNASVYRSLNLNPGNVNAYLKHGNVEKVSLDNAKRILDYVHDAQPASLLSRDNKEGDRP